MYFVAKKRLGDKTLESSGAVLTLVSLVLYHVIYFVILEDIGRIVAGVVIMLILAALNKYRSEKAFEKVFGISLLVVIYSLFLVTINPFSDMSAFVILSGLIYGVIFFLGYQFSKYEFLIYTAHFLLVHAACRSGAIIGEIWVGPICVAYAFICMLFALKTSDKSLARASFPVVFFDIGRFYLFNFGDLGPLERIISLVLMGGFIYAGGFVYRKIPARV